MNICIPGITGKFFWIFCYSYIEGHCHEKTNTAIRKKKVADPLPSSEHHLPNSCNVICILRIMVMQPSSRHERHKGCRIQVAELIPRHVCAIVIKAAWKPLPCKIMMTNISIYMALMTNIKLQISPGHIMPCVCHRFSCFHSHFKKKCNAPPCVITEHIDPKSLEWTSV